MSVLRSLLALMTAAAFATPIILGDHWVTLVVWLSTALMIGLLVRPENGWQFVGPHAFYELVRLARRGRMILLRVVFLGVLLGALSWGYERAVDGRVNIYGKLIEVSGDPDAPQKHRSLSINTMAAIAERFAFTVFFGQNLAILLLCPIYFGSAIAEEKERRTLELLFSTQLSSREILLGKLVSRGTHVGALLLAGLPVLSLAQFFGGINTGLIVANYINSALLLIAAGSLCLAISAMAENVTGAVMACYVAMLIGGSCLLGGTQGSVLRIDEAYAGLLVTAVACGFVTLMSWGLAIDAMKLDRNEHYLTSQRPQTPTVREQALIARREIVFQRPPPIPRPPLTDDANPLLWKDGPRVGLGVPTAIGYLLLLFALTGSLRLNHADRAAIVAVYQGFGGFAFVFAGIALYSLVGLGASAAIAGERESQTLDTLLMLPCERNDILKAKWRASLWRGRAWYVLVGGLLVGGLLSGLLNRLTGWFFAASLALHLVFLNSLALFFSVVSATTLLARMRTLLVVLVLVFGSLVLEVLGQGRNPLASLLEGMNPVCFALLFFRATELPPAGTLRFPEAIVLGHALLALGAAIFYSLALIEFRGPAYEMPSPPSSDENVQATGQSRSSG